MTNAKIGADELRIVARPASTDCSAHAISVYGITLLRQAWNRKRRQTAPSIGMAKPRQRSMHSSTAAAIAVRAAINVTGGMVSTPTLMNV